MPSKEYLLRELFTFYVQGHSDILGLQRNRLLCTPTDLRDIGLFSKAYSRGLQMSHGCFASYEDVMIKK
jgi:hypothetical protein